MVPQRGHLMGRSNASPLANNLLHSPHRMSLIPFSLQVALALLRSSHPWSPDHGQGAAGASWWTGVASPGQWDGCNPSRLLRFYAALGSVISQIFSSSASWSAITPRAMADSVSTALGLASSMASSPGSAG